MKTYHPPFSKHCLGQILLTTLLLFGGTKVTRAQTPAITGQPGSTNIPTGLNATFKVAVGIPSGGSASARAQWFSNDVAMAAPASLVLVSGTNYSSTITVSNVGRSIAAGFVCAVTNSFGAVTSSVANLFISPVRVWGDNTYGQQVIPLSVSNITAIASGSSHCVALRADGAVIAWGRGDSGQTNVPVDLTNAVAIASRNSHNLALRSDGTVVGWGTNVAEELTPPVSLTNAVAIALGTRHSVALTSNRTVVVWGANDVGQLNIPPWTTNVVAIAAGQTHSVALREDGSMVVWGDNLQGQLAAPADATNVLAIAAGNTHSLALRADGKILRWGNYTYTPGSFPVTTASNFSGVFPATGGAIGIKSNGSVTVEGSFTTGLVSGTGLGVDNRATNLTTLTAGGAQIMAIENNGRPSFTVQPFDRSIQAGGPVTFYARAVCNPAPLFQWRFNSVVIPDATNNSLTFSAVNATNVGNYDVVVSNSVGVVTSRVATLAVTQKIKVALWGVNGYGEVWWPAEFPGVTQLGAGGDGTLVIKPDGSLTSWIGNKTSWQTNFPATAVNIVSIIPCDTHALALRANGTLAAWINPAYGSPISSTFSNSILNPSGGLPSGVVSIATGSSYCLALKGDGTLPAWGSSDFAFLKPSFSSLTTIATGVKAIAGSDYVAAAVKTDGTVQVLRTQQGFENTISNVPSGLTDATDIAVGWHHVVVLRSNGTVVAWGENYEGETNMPAGLSNVIAIAAAANHSLALCQDGSLVGWGDNSYGEAQAPVGLTNIIGIAAGIYRSFALVGDSAPCITKQPQGRTTLPGSTFMLGCTATGTSPLAFQWQHDNADISGATNSLLTLTNVSAADIGGYRVIIINASGSVTSQLASVSLGSAMVWGFNYWEQTDLPPGLNVASIAGGFDNSIALQSDGTVATWGFPIGTVPTNLSPATAIAAGTGLVLALQQNGTVRGWDRFNNYYAESDFSLGLSNVVSIAAGRYFAAALRQDGTVAAWGEYRSGQTNVPVGLSNVIAIACGDDHVLALKADGLVVAWGNSSGGATNVPVGLSNVVAVAAGQAYSLALKTDGSLIMWGSYPTPSTGLSNIMAVAAGFWNVLALKNDGSLISWGRRADLNIIPNGVSNVTQIASGYRNHMAIVGDGRPAFMTRLVQRSVHAGDTLQLPALAAGGQPMTFQWLFNGNELSGQTNALLSIGIAPLTLAGDYQVVASNAFGVVTGAVTSVTVTRDPIRFETDGASLQISNGAAALRLSGLAGGGDVVLFGSTNLIDWTPIFTNPPVIGSLDFTNVDTISLPSQYFKVVEGP